jgi:hypothetical protein
MENALVETRSTYSCPACGTNRLFGQIQIKVDIGWAATAFA